MARRTCSTPVPSSERRKAHACSIVPVGHLQTHTSVPRLGQRLNVTRRAENATKLP